MVASSKETAEKVLETQIMEMLQALVVKANIDSGSAQPNPTVPSVMSFESEDLEDVFEKAPHDLFHESPKLGKILVLREGEKVPTLTKYKKTKKGGLTAVRFRLHYCSFL